MKNDVMCKAITFYVCASVALAAVSFAVCGGIFHYVTLRQP